MKNTVRIHRNGGTKAASHQTETVQPVILCSLADLQKAEADFLLDPELKEEIAGWSIHKRSCMADKFRRWAAELDRSVALLEWIEDHNPEAFDRNRN